LIFLALLYICNKLFGPVCLYWVRLRVYVRVCEKRARSPHHSHFCMFLFGFFDSRLIFTHVLVEHTRFLRHSYPGHRFAMRILNKARTR